MNKGASFVVGLGLLSLLGGAAVVMKSQQEAVVKADPAEAAALRAANTANAAILNQASNAYSSAHGKPADEPSQLTGSGMIDHMPEEAFSKQSSWVAVYDGKGGWVYAAGQFSPNHPQVLDAK